ncbi:MAG: flavodoxin domain-containing protein [Dehalococcoidales bacterium]
MGKVLVAYFSLNGHTETMAQYIAEGIRIAGHEATVARVSTLKNINDVQGYAGHIFGSPTFHRDMAEPMKTFLFLAGNADLESKLGAAFGSYTHSGDAPALISDTMQYVFKMKMTELGSFNLKEAVVDTTEGNHTCQDYGRVFGGQLET